MEGLYMSSYVLIEAFQYKELDTKGKNKVLRWLDDAPMEYEVENEDGMIVTEYQYFSEMDESDVQDHCQVNEYLFDKHGKPIHNLVLTEHKLNEEKQNGQDEA